jgi:hypothetical protein
LGRQLGTRRIRGDADECGPIPCDLIGQNACVLTRGERDDLQPIGMRVDNGERASAN